MSTEHETDQATWNERYSGSTRVWSGQANVALMREVEHLNPGRALDLGCGEGADAVWLAKRGWKVTAVDVSDVALARAAEHAQEAGVAEAIEWQQRDLVADFPPGEFDLVSVQFLYPVDAAARETVLRSASRAVAPGGILLIEGHSGSPAWHRHEDADTRFLKPEEVMALLRLEAGEWDVLMCEEHERVQNDPDGNPTTRTDSTLKLRRH